MTVGRTGFEPVKVKPADLQSALVGRLSISPRNFKLLKYVLYFEPAEGFEPTTPRLQITCSGQLSYTGKTNTYTTKNKRFLLLLCEVQIYNNFLF